MSSDPQIYVRGFSKNCKESDLKEAFNKYGSIKEVRLIRDYAFIVYSDRQQVNKAVDGMDGGDLQGYKLKVEVAGRPRKPKGPQPDDECRYCHKLGHWQNDCPQYTRYKKRNRRRHRSYSSESSSSSSQSSRSRERRRRRKDKKSKKSRKRSYSSSSSSSSQSSSSKSASREEKIEKRRSSKQENQKVQKN